MTFECSECSQFFIGSNLLKCLYHPEKPTFSLGSNKGVYKCCEKECLRFSTRLEKGGCKAQVHKISWAQDPE